MFHSELLSEQKSQRELVESARTFSGKSAPRFRKYSATELLSADRREACAKVRERAGVVGRKILQCSDAYRGREPECGASQCAQSNSLRFNGRFKESVKKDARLPNLEIRRAGGLSNGAATLGELFHRGGHCFTVRKIRRYRWRVRTSIHFDRADLYLRPGAASVLSSRIPKSASESLLRSPAVGAPSDC